MHLLAKKRKNQAYREVEDNGITWRINRHGVATRYKDDPYFAGMVVVDFPNPRHAREMAEYAFATDPTFRRCTCC